MEGLIYLFDLGFITVSLIFTNCQGQNTAFVIFLNVNKAWFSSQGVKIFILFLRKSEQLSLPLLSVSQA